MGIQNKSLPVSWTMALVALGVGLVLYAFNPATVPIFPVCLFHQWTGLNCPGCGSLRAMHQLLHGNVVEAFRLNALLVISIPIGVWFGIRLLRQHLRNEPGPIVRPLWIWIYALVWLVFGIVRELPVQSFAVWPP
ncbi:MAG TPA: DUF2752 domain-containing protein [Verrucomicrobiae bacterium]|nr:DUF2752 domain-containing protein [Verrucomicrobiae bacterium]